MGWDGTRREDKGTTQSVRSSKRKIAISIGLTPTETGGGWVGGGDQHGLLAYLALLLLADEYLLGRRAKRFRVSESRMICQL